MRVQTSFLTRLHVYHPKARRAHNLLGQYEASEEVISRTCGDPSTETTESSMYVRAVSTDLGVDSGSQRGARRSVRLGHPKTAPTSPNRVHQHLYGIGTALVDHLDSREVEDHRRLARDQVDNPVDRGSRGPGDRTDERRDAVLRIVAKVDQQ
jgi:hypothetical protein